uniref:Reverse transcriptase domain-containing protein n=1 Tax=Cannabis sativa TaxID=3483 RepID=A0A803Q6R6_CANSA
MLSSMDERTRICGGVLSTICGLSFLYKSSFFTSQFKDDTTHLIRILVFGSISIGVLPLAHVAPIWEWLMDKAIPGLIKKLGDKCKCEKMFYVKAIVKFSLLCICSVVTFLNNYPKFRIQYSKYSCCFSERNIHDVISVGLFSALAFTQSYEREEPVKISMLSFLLQLIMDTSIESLGSNDDDHKPTNFLYMSGAGPSLEALQRWHVSKFGNFKKQISEVQKKVSLLNNAAATLADMIELQNSESILDDLLAQEEKYWHQRSRVDWLQSGDQNTKFFHAHATSRKSKNTIRSLINSQGFTVTSKTDMTNTICAYYDNLFASDGVDHASLQQVLAAVPTTISNDMNQSLIQPFTSQEVYDALKSMSPDKSPGCDGMSAMFYQNYWNIVGTSVTNLVLGVLNNGLHMRELNKSIITLIPKVPNPSSSSMMDYRPISLCNVIYKIISKTIVIRFKKVLPFVISETQSAFLSNRLIMDNILIAFELIHHIRHKTQGRVGVSALKLDMSKAFDRVEWQYLEAIMLKMGFDIALPSLIMRCITSSSFSFSLNGEEVGQVLPSRGLHQGDPLSPYLFLICSERLSRLLHSKEQAGMLNGLKWTRHSPSVSHLLFADDSLLFCQSNEQSAMAIKQSLDTYHKASGQVLNNDKSVMSFSPNTSQAAQNFFSQTLQMPITECHERYLGLPSYSGRDKNELFSNIKEKVWKLLNSWNEKNFSVGGKEVLLKDVVQSIPTYAMSCFRLTKKFCNQLESMMANFWWGSNQNGTRIHWKRWKSLCKSKYEGGMGFRSFVHFNQALLAKQAWRIFDMPDSLLRRLLKHRYFSNYSFLDANIGHSPSLTWQSICWGKELLVKGLRYKVGNGTHIDCKHDPWIPGFNEFKPVSFSGSHSLPVSSFITEERVWNVPMLNRYFQPIDSDRILSIPLSFFADWDRLIWHYTSNGSYTVQSGFHRANSLEEKLSSSTLDNQSRVAKWQPPQFNGFKMNVDAATNEEHKKLGIGALIRDHNGTVIAAFSKVVQGNFRSDEMEAKALFHALIWALQNQLSITHIETDALRVSSAINHASTDLSCFSDLITDCIELEKWEEWEEFKRFDRLERLEKYSKVKEWEKVEEEFIKLEKWGLKEWEKLEKYNKGKELEEERYDEGLSNLSLEDEVSIPERLLEKESVLEEFIELEKWEEWEEFKRFERLERLEKYNKGRELEKVGEEFKRLERLEKYNKGNELEKVEEEFIELKKRKEFLRLERLKEWEKYNKGKELEKERYDEGLSNLSLEEQVSIPERLLNKELAIQGLSYSSPYKEKSIRERLLDQYLKQRREIDEKLEDHSKQVKQLEQLEQLARHLVIQSKREKEELERLEKKKAKQYVDELIKSACPYQASYNTSSPTLEEVQSSKKKIE